MVSYSTSGSQTTALTVTGLAAGSATVKGAASATFNYVIYN
jgi:hypothetical protein